MPTDDPAACNPDPSTVPKITDITDSTDEAAH
jgi:hypothetical protein